MLPLRDLQRAFASALISNDAGAVSGLIDASGISATNRFGVYAANREAALLSTLRLTYPAVEALVGEAFFASVGQEFVRDQLPASPLLTLYGAGFPAFLQSNTRAAHLPYLVDVARLEWAASQVTQTATGFSARTFPVGAVSIALSASLIILPLRYHASAIWRAALDADEAALSRIALDPSPAAVAVWRRGPGVSAVELSDAAAAFVECLMTHGDVAIAIADAAVRAADPIAVIRDEILQADFVHLQPLAA